MDVEKKEEILDLANKVSSGDYEVTWENNSAGVPKLLKKKSEIAKGKKSKKSGGDFELKVRKDLEERGWIVAKWPNNVDLDKKEIIPAKRIFNPFRKVMTIGTGFPDFVAFQLVGEKMYNVIGVESKLNGLLSKEEKEKCAFLLNKKVFNNIWMGSKSEDGKVEYIDFKEKFGEKFNAI